MGLPVRAIIPALQPAAGVLTWLAQPFVAPARLREVVIVNVGTIVEYVSVYHTPGSLSSLSRYAWLPVAMPIQPGAGFAYEAETEDAGRLMAVGDALVILSATGFAVFSGSYVSQPL